MYSKPWCLSLSGGEVFLYYDRLLEYCSTAFQLGGYTTLITNCFWATSLERAQELLVPLSENGLQILGVSYDKFHDPYIDASRIKNAIWAARGLKIRVHVRSVAIRSSRLWHIMERVADGNCWFVDYMEMACVPAGRAITEIPADEMIYLEEFPTGRCLAASLTINPRGDGMLCCNSAGELPGMNVGNVRNLSLAQLEDSFRYSPLVNFLVRKGPAATLEFLDSEEQRGLRRKKYVSVCHLCHDIFHDDMRRRKIEREVLAESWTHIQHAIPGIGAEIDKFRALPNRLVSAEIPSLADSRLAMHPSEGGRAEDS